MQKKRSYAKDSHEWISILDSKTAMVGISVFAADSLQDIVFVELPQVGRNVKKHEVICIIESVKTASEIYSPIDGEIIGINETLVDNPDLLNDDPLTHHLFIIKSNTDIKLQDFITEDEYQAKL